jgi:dihydrolipoamide dehydrogenase
MMADRYDLIVLGSGPGGYVAAIRASQLGMKTAIVERESLGGICLNWGCIPTKALLRSSEVHHLLRHAGDYGLEVGEVRIDLERIVKRSRQVAGQLSGGVKHLMKKHKITVVEGDGRLAGKGKLAVTRDGKTTDLEAPHIIIATGARARTAPGLEPDGVKVLTYREAMVPKSLPKRLLVIGSGAIGIEFASFYAEMGSAVTVVEMVDRILPAEDEEISAFALKAFRKRGLTIHTGAAIKRLDTSGAGVVADVEAGGKALRIEADQAILAIGIVGNVEDIGLEEAGVEVARNHIVADPFGRTKVPGLYAIGDVTGAPWLAHKAMHEGVVCVEKIAGVQGVHPIDLGNVPGCTYCMPQVASVGLSEAKAKAAGHEVRVGRFPFIGNGKAIALGEPEGMVKTVFDAKTGALLGAHMIGAEVTEMIQGYVVARTLETTEAELMATIYPHPTLSETMHEAVLDAYGRPLHI